MTLQPEVLPGVGHTSTQLPLFARIAFSVVSGPSLVVIVTVTGGSLMALAKRPAVKAMPTPDKRKGIFFTKIGVQGSSYNRSNQARRTFSRLASEDAKADPFYLINMD